MFVTFDEVLCNRHHLIAAAAAAGGGEWGQSIRQDFVAR